MQAMSTTTMKMMKTTTTRKVQHAESNAQTPTHTSLPTLIDAASGRYDAIEVDVPEMYLTYL